MIIARFKAKGQRVQAGIFLVDVFCLGAKLAVYEDCDIEDYRRRIRDHYQSSFPMVSAEPCCARKLVEQAVQYAQMCIRDSRRRGQEPELAAGGTDAAHAWY